MSRVLLVRHTETENRGALNGWNDAGLSAAGVAAMADVAAEVAVQLGGSEPPLVFASDLSRARRLAETIAPAVASDDPLLVPTLREENYGAWERRRWEELLAGDEAIAARAFLDDFVNRAPPGGESFGAMATRVFAAFEEIQSRAAGDATIVVCHAGPIRALVCRSRGLPLSAAFDLKVPFGSIVEV